MATRSGSAEGLGAMSSLVEQRDERQLMRRRDQCLFKLVLKIEDGAMRFPHKYGVAFRERLLSHDFSCRMYENTHAHSTSPECRFALVTMESLSSIRST